MNHKKDDPWQRTKLFDLDKLNSNNSKPQASETTIQEKKTSKIYE